MKDTLTVTNARPALVRERIPSLDGLRAVAISVAIFGHATGQLVFSPLGGIRIPNPGYSLGVLGVRMFLVISGFLITSQLLDERERYGGIDVGRFYGRRLLRLAPAYYVYLIVVCLVSAAGPTILGTNDLLHALTYSINYAVTPGWSVLHLWSLALEMQFYLLWPVIMATTSRHRAKQIALGVLIVVPLIRLAEAVVHPEWRTTLIGHSFETSIDAIATGCLLAFVKPAKRRDTRVAGILDGWWPPFVLLVIGIPLLAPRHPFVVFLVGLPLTNIAMALLVRRAIRGESSALERLLNSAPFVAVGALSYSLYLWQQLFIGADEYTFQIAHLAMALACATASYWLIEKPCQSLRTRLSRTSPGASEAPSG